MEVDHVDTKEKVTRVKPQRSQTRYEILGARRKQLAPG